MKKNITKEWLEEKSACFEGVVWWEKCGENNSIKILKKLIKEKKYEWANWFIVRVMDYKQYVSYAVFAAEQVLDIYEKKYPNDKLPRRAIEAAKKCIDNPSEENKKAADDAASAVDASAAYDAASAAYDAAYAAASAVDAAAAAASAADAAAAAYADAAAAAYAAMKLKILKYGIKLLERRIEG